jgi:NADH-quinone oxidoreductase subunit L
MQETPETAAAFLRWIVLLPLLGAALNGLTNPRLPRPIVAGIGVGSVVGSFALSLLAFLRLSALPSAQRVLVDRVYTWMPIGDLRADVAFQVDALSAVMILVVTGVGALIHLYSVGYMAQDRGFQRYFAYLNLFVFAMLVLVTADNLLLLFLGWEGVGLCSYLLIGFWFQDLANSVAGKKAFVVNRVGDFGFLLGMLLIARALAGHAEGGNLLAFRTMAAHRDLLLPVATATGLLLFLGATGKSAQIPLFVWLPDAMAGPTPVSALIHAATMVTAGVYMVARMHFLYDLAPAALHVIAVVGALTALLAATIALVQNDIKKLLAYSTVSQLGYMFLACGVGAYATGIFHVMTHAFFKALLFLGAGSVIQALHHEQDLRRMGGLRGAMPVTFRTMAVATLAIAGIFPLAGFFSKDEILYAAFRQSPLLWLVGLLVAGLTAFYMTRMMVLAFLGQRRTSAAAAGHDAAGSGHGIHAAGAVGQGAHDTEVHESPALLTAPLVVLALLSVIGGWIGWPQFLGGGNPFHQWLAPVFERGTAVEATAVAGAAAPAAVAHAVAEGAGAHVATAEWTLALLSLAVALAGLTVSLRIYTRGARAAGRAQAFAGGAVYRLLAGKYFVDELYDAAIVRPVHWVSDRVLWRTVDAGLIDGVAVNGIGRLLALIGALVRTVQNGLLRWYAYSFAVGVIMILVYLARRF